MCKDIINVMEGKRMYIKITKVGIRTMVEFSHDNKRFFTPNTFFDMKANDYEINIDTGKIKRCGRADTFYIDI
jgi:hypothetical protein